ncbi:MAM and LDL-receptor class A domain-containing protein 1 [Lingula anatina]|uniref:MAM and LDL-receptor class A domain-containing protein 1 n=1 Tax=Lingula anatina TaxID=7574 RepID=A0A2R2MU23_LINAN|nr:MAM and LDL-receptor class A domain-containing protein 1 [Lingula anatina]|eukprot:XP_023933562.1 MAM and LDL-receptor class A domain-containing protein 1 [Lingula anatina]
MGALCWLRILVLHFMFLVTTSGKELFTCNFDDSSDPLCGFVATKATGKFQWQRRKAYTSSTNTGPTADHTGNGGYYVYTEASGSSNNDKAELTSPNLAVLSSIGGCMVFYYHMYGSAMGSLRVHTTSDLTNALWSKDGDQGNFWHRAEVDIPPGTGQVVFEGVRGTNIWSDMAIDDLLITDDACDSGGGGGTAGDREEFQCTFDEDADGTCGFTQPKNDDFDWTRFKGATSSSATGPSEDHTDGNGYYMYTEASGKGSGYTANLQSTSFPLLNIDRCLSFAYHMYGRNIGSLTVQKLSGGQTTSIWNENGNKGDKWQEASISLPPGSFAVVFQAVRGNGYQCDIAIDDVTMYRGDCQTVWLCTFDKDICSFEQSQSDHFDWTRHSGRTPSSNTGPSRDHTTMSENGHYMYIEANGVSYNKLADLKTKNMQFASEHCLVFYYHMYGFGTMGDLSVFSSVDLKTALWFRRGENLGDIWNLALVPLSAGEYSIIFQGKTRYSKSSDIAIDDVMIRTGACPPYPTTPPPTTTTTTQKTTATTKATTTMRSTSTTKTTTTRPTSKTTTPTSTTTIKTTAATTSVNYPTTDTTTERETTSIDSISTKMIPSSTETTTKDMPGLAGLTPTDHSILASRELTSPTSQSLTTEYPRLTFGDPLITVFNCTFETSICGIEQSASDDFDWTRSQGSTSSTGTGPSGDHTTGSGYYMYIEASSPRMYRHTARLVLPSAILTPVNIPRCLRFAYHMFGTRTGTLNVLALNRSNVMAPNQAGNKYDWETLWSLSGNQYNVWYEANVTVTPGTSLVAFEAIKGNGYQSDIAIDDVVVDNGDCDTAWICTFEYSFCGFTTQSSFENVTWERNSPEPGGHSWCSPGGDATLVNGNGSYAFLNLSGNLGGSHFVLMSPEITMTTDYCLEFQYYVFSGAGRGALLAIFLLFSNGFRRQVWNETIGNSAEWHQTYAPLPSGSYRLLFDVTQTDIQCMGLDDVIIRKGSCPETTTVYTPSSTQFGDDTTVSGTTSGPIFTSTEQSIYHTDHTTPAFSETTVDKETTTHGLSIDTNVELNCTFEELTICGFRQSKNDTFNWNRGQGSTSSSNTGPSSDHTTGNGFYMYIESSSPRRPGDQAVLLYPVLPQLNIPRCTQFAFHMYGVHIGSLKVSVDTSALAVWTMEGDQGNKWRVSSATLPPQFTEISFTATRGTEYRGDIAIDDVILAKGRCDAVWVCTFDGSQCGFQSSVTNGLSWKWYSGATLEPKTGPSGDHTLTTGLGRYMYLAHTGLVIPGISAAISSPQLTLQEPGCLVFYYHMWGSDIGTLNVYSMNGSTHLLWSKSKAQGNTWLEARVTIPSDTYSVMFEGVAGNGTSGDIGLDDVMVETGACIAPSTTLPTTSSEITSPTVSSLSISSSTNKHSSKPTASKPAVTDLRISESTYNYETTHFKQTTETVSTTSVETLSSGTSEPLTTEQLSTRHETTYRPLKTMTTEFQTAISARVPSESVTVMTTERYPIPTESSKGSSKAAHSTTVSTRYPSVASQTWGIGTSAVPVQRGTSTTILTSTPKGQFNATTRTVEMTQGSLSTVGTGGKVTKEKDNNPTTLSPTVKVTHYPTTTEQNARTSVGPPTSVTLTTFSPSLSTSSTLLTDKPTMERTTTQSKNVDTKTTIPKSPKTFEFTTTESERAQNEMTTAVHKTGSQEGQSEKDNKEKGTIGGIYMLH